MVKRKHREKHEHLKVATHNTRTLLYEERLAEMENELDNISWGIFGISEVRRGRESIQMLKSGYKFDHFGE